MGDLKNYVNNKYNTFVNSKIMAFEKTRLETKYPDFKSLLKEYRDGILLFEISDQMIWSKAIKDTTGLKDFYQKNKSKWMWEDRLEIEIFSSSNKKVIKKAYALKKKGKLKNDSILNYLNKDSQLTIKFEEGKKTKTDLPFIESSGISNGINKPFLHDNKYYLVNLINEIPSKPKEIYEAEGAITAAYQEYLEKKWLSELSEKYNIEVNYDVLYSIVNKPN
jgi:peptidyl-prolyl cis-trans isomerase SurA